MATETEAMRTRAFPRLAWAPIVAGVFLAVAAHVLLGLIGAALGLAAEPAGSKALGVLAGLWGLLTALVATLLGAWLACRLAALEDVTATNLHGVMVWCIGIIAGALFLTGTTATGAMAAGTAMSGNVAGTMQRRMGQPTPSRSEAMQDAAAGSAAKVAGGAAMAALAGLLGAFGGAAIARSRREGKGLGWRIAIQRTAHQGQAAGDGSRIRGGPSTPTGRIPSPQRRPPAKWSGRRVRGLLRAAITTDSARPGPVPVPEPEICHPRSSLLRVL